MNKDKIRDFSIIGVLAAFTLGGYLLYSSIIFRVGFPLDDAWIHQVYARNIAQEGEWAFVPGISSAGSTAPLWSGLLSIGYLINLAPFYWTFFLGWLILWSVGVMGYLGFCRMCPQYMKKAILVGIFLVLEWHLVWAAGSGMETLLFGLIALSVIMSLIKLSDCSDNYQVRIFISIGALIGISIWVRPDGITLLGPVLLVLAFDDCLRGKRWKLLGSLSLVFGIGIATYLIFNQILAGSIWPNTFYAKQEEYSLLQQLPIWRRILDQIRLPLIGVGILLLPGFILFMFNTIKQRAVGEIAGWVWILGFLVMYALRLPVIYQHGRYVIPVMPTFFVMGLVGIFNIIEINSSDTIRRIASRIWVLLIGAILIVFWIVGARAYATDVAIIESEMVTVSRWLSENTNPDDLIAVHDIGAIGYYSERNILDLAGLVSPDVIPIIRDESAIAELLDRNKVSYLVTFPSWYPYLIDQADLIYVTEGEFSVDQGGENMGVYRWRID